MRNVLSDEERRFIKDYVLLQLVAAVFERDKALFEKSRLKIKKPYILAIDKALDQVHKYLSRLKKSLREKNIRFIGEQRSATGLILYIVCRGYQHCNIYLWDHLIICGQKLNYGCGNILDCLPTLSRLL